MDTARNRFWCASCDGGFSSDEEATFPEDERLCHRCGQIFAAESAAEAHGARVIELEKDLEDSHRLVRTLQRQGQELRDEKVELENKLADEHDACAPGWEVRIRAVEKERDEARALLRDARYAFLGLSNDEEHAESCCYRRCECTQQLAKRMLAALHVVVCEDCGKSHDEPWCGPAFGPEVIPDASS